MIDIKYLYPFWGSNNLTPQEFLNIVSENDFQGIEIDVLRDVDFESNLFDALCKIRKSNPSFICGLQQVLPIKQETPKDYLDKVLKRLNKLKNYDPTFINSHTGKDHYSFSDNCKIIDAIETFSIKHNIPVYHEIHRGRFSFHSQTTLRYLERFPRLKLVADFSHWCVVSESMLEDQGNIIEKIIPNIEHIHARVGFEQSPQVNNPFAPEWNKHLNKFMQWWKQIIDYQSKKGTITITPEFGPFPYMPQEPFSEIPLSDQKELNCKMKEYLKTYLK